MRAGGILGPVARDLTPVALGALIGLGGGLGAVGFKLLLDLTHLAAWRHPGSFPGIAQASGAFWTVVIPTLGGLLVGLITQHFAREARGHGVPEVISAIVRHGGRIRPRIVFVKAIASAVCIGSGGSCGREGPIAQIGSAWGSTVAQWLPKRPVPMRVLVGAGAAAGISATFNAPIAGVVFALEVLLRDFGLRSLTPIIVAGVSAVAVAHALIPDHATFTIPPHAAPHAMELFFFALLGLGAGAVGVAFIRTLYGVEDLADRIAAPLWVKAGLGGLGTGLLALAVPQVLGVGYTTVSATLDPGNAKSLADAGLGGVSVFVLLGLLGAKMLATALTLGFGGSGGVFAPSLFLGAAYGCAFGYALDAMFPGAALGSPGTYAMVGMAAVVSATTHAPLCSMLILFEMTHDYRMILPLMLATVLATLIAQRILPESIYTMKMVRRGERVRYGADLNILERIAVHEVMDGETDPVSDTTPLDAILHRIQRSRHNDVPVVDDTGRLTGMVCFRDIKPVMRDPALHPVVIATDLIRPVAALRTGDTLDVALTRFANEHVDELPVVDDDKLVGVLGRADLMARYQAEIALLQDA